MSKETISSILKEIDGLKSLLLNLMESSQEVGIDQDKEEEKKCDINRNIEKDDHNIKKEELRKKFFSENNFDKYINTLPKYCIKSKSKYEKYIKDYLIKNRSAKLSDIVHGCQEQGLKFEAHDLNSIFYKSLKNLVESGQVTKKDKIYFWNYNE